ncbi:hypothetical protein [Paraburkholderia fungorum]|uniref:hypothetical protein n=1 Tax=Paraburkholderia fungorum TaxID=134537 RepID=UPI0038BDFE15
MKIRSAEWLAAVAIVTSASVLQIREHMQSYEAPSVAPQASFCGARHDGLIPAGCEPARNEQWMDRAALPQHNAPRIWV